MKTAVIYARYSSDSQTEQSIEGQLHVCHEYAKSHDILILHTYIDRAMTGTNDNRPDFQQMIKDSNRREWDYVLVYKFDRFSRNKYETAMHKKTLKDNGIKVVSATEYIPDTPEAIIFESMLEGMAEYYSAELSQKIRRGNNESRHKGNLTGGHVLYGYKNVNKKAVIVEEEADAIRYMFSQYASNVYVKDIIKTLTARGILFGGKPFKCTTVHKILRNERYTGIYKFKGETFENIYPQIVPKEIFDFVRQKVDENKYGRHSDRVQYLLKNKVKCGYCGESVTGENGKMREGTSRYYYYKCRGRKAHITDCKKETIRKETLEKIVLDCIIEELSNPTVMDDLVNKILQAQEQKNKKRSIEITLQKEKNANELAIKNIMSAIEQGGVVATLMERLRELEKRQSEIEGQILIEKSKTEITVTESQIRKFYNDALSKNSKMMVDLLIKVIILYDDKIEIFFKTPLTGGSDDDRGFSFALKKVGITYDVPQRKTPVSLRFDIFLRI